MTVNQHWKGITLFILPVLILFGMFFIYPLGYVFVISLTKFNGVGAPTFVGLKNYIDNFTDRTFQLAVRNNVIWALSLGGIQVGLAAGVAMILARRPPGWRVLRTVYFLPNVISKVAIAMLWLAVYNADYGALNALLTAIGLEQWTMNWLGTLQTALPAVILQELLYIGYFMIIVLAGVMSIPDSYYEAAEIDGASVYQQEIFITIPMVRNIFVIAMTLAMAFGLRHFEATFLMTRGGPAHATTVMGLMLYNDLEALDYGHGNAVAATLIVVGGILIAAIRKFVGSRSGTEEAMQ